MINNRFFFYQTYDAFNRDIKNIPYTAIVFIKNPSIIYTHGTYYSTSLNLTIDSQLSSTSTNPVLNKIIKAALDNKVDTIALQSYATLNDLYHISLNVDKLIEKAKGCFSSFEVLQQSIPNPSVGEWAIITESETWLLALCETEGQWTLTDLQYEHQDVDLTEYVKNENLQLYALKQDLNEYAKTADLDDTYLRKLVSGENIKTINGASILGSGNILLSSGSSYSYIPPLASDTEAGLMTPSQYTNLNALLRTTIPSIQENIRNLESIITNGDDSDLQDIINKYNNLVNFINQLDSESGSSESTLYAISQLVSQLQTSLRIETNRAIAVETELKDRIEYLLRSIENISSLNYKWVFGDPLPARFSITSQSYSNSWVFGDKLPAKFVKNTNYATINYVDKLIEKSNKNKLNLVILTQRDYDALTEYENNTIYFIIESTEEEQKLWTFDDVFPVVLDGDWGFDGTFPVKLI